ncbi:MAG: GTPase HflX [Candidatus Zophobacter franzmannii]|nr:GTPase HflX [Candidatus Zophobacter franzmannii]
MILDIFAIHARTKRAKLQVELAQLEYSYSRLKNLWGHLSRIDAEIGDRGPGEKQLEIDRRLIQKRISHLKDKLEEVRKVTYTKRQNRKNFKVIALVGYTNAGKSTIFNRLTHADVYTANKLFATLDPSSHYIPVPKGNQSILTDTIGFIKELPHCLVESFHSTLLEVVNADLLLHVVDLSDSEFKDNIDAVDKVLKEIGADMVDTVYIFNKTDVIGGMAYKFLKKQLQVKYPCSLFISATNDEDLSVLLDKICSRLENMKSEVQLVVSSKMEKLIPYLESKAEVLSIDCDEVLDSYLVQVRGGEEVLAEAKDQIDKYKQLEYINS